MYPFARRVGGPAILPEQLRCQRLQPLFSGHSGPGPALGAVGPVQILHLRQGPGSFHGPPEGRGQLPLAFHGAEHLFPPLLETAQVPQFGLQISQCGVIHGSVELLPVAGDEGDGVSLIQKLHHIFHILCLLSQLPGQNLHNCVHIPVHFSHTSGNSTRRRRAGLSSIVPQNQKLTRSNDAVCPGLCTGALAPALHRLLHPGVRCGLSPEVYGRRCLR